MSPSDEEPDPELPALQQMLRREFVERVRQAIAKLPVDHQQVIHLAFDEDLSSRDIAGIMNKPSVTAVSSHLYRAMQALRKVLEADGYFAELQERDDLHVRARKIG